MFDHLTDNLKDRWEDLTDQVGRWSNRAAERVSRAGRGVTRSVGHGVSRGASSLNPSHWNTDWIPNRPWGRDSSDDEWDAKDTLGEVLRGVGWLALGAGLMYFLDPQQGRRRRALVRDKLVRYGRDAGGAAARAGTATANRARGLTAEGLRKVRREQVSDEVLVARIRSAMGRGLSNPGAVRVVALEGKVTVYGDVPAGERAAFLSTVRAVPGVAEVIDQLSPSPEAQNA